MNRRILEKLKDPVCYLGITSIFLLLLITCGLDSDTPVPTSTDTGSIVFTVEWHGGTDEGSGYQVQHVPDNVCADYGIDWITCRIKDATGAEVASERWPCSGENADGSRSGTIACSPGDNMNLELEGEVSGPVMWKGQSQSSFSVTAGRTSDAGTIVMNYVGNDQDPPGISSVNPQEDALNVIIGGVITAHFDEDVVASSVKQSFTLQSGGIDVAGNVDYDSSSLKGTFTPSTPLEKNKVFQASITTDVEDLAGNHMLAPKIWSFTTGQESEWYRDGDQDGFPDLQDKVVSLNRPGSDYFLSSELTQMIDDCDDDNPNSYPGNTEGPAGDAKCSDGADNDCDGKTDTGDDGCVAACQDSDGDGYGDPGEPGCPNGGAKDCNDTDSEIHPGAVEKCDGKDNDCNAATLDGSAESWLNSSCDGADSDLCLEGTFSCSGGTKTCSDTTGSTVDLCGGGDEDCNPATADGSGESWIGSACDGSDTDQCKEGTYSCSGGAQVCSDTTGNNVELCWNAKDDDCDGSTDEGCSLTQPNPVAYYPVNGNANDGSGNGNHGTVMGGALFVDDCEWLIGDKALKLDGVNDYITVPDRSILDITGNISLVAWVNPAQQKTQGIIRKGAAYDLSLVSNGDIVFSIITDAGTYQVKKNGYSLNTRTFIVATYNRSTVPSMRLYVNGVSAASLHGTGLMSANLDNLLIGARTTSPSSVFSGTLDEIAVYNRALTSADVYTLYQKSICQPIIIIPPKILQ